MGSLTSKAVRESPIVMTITPEISFGQSPENFFTDFAQNGMIAGLAGIFSVAD